MTTITPQAQAAEPTVAPVQPGSNTPPVEAQPGSIPVNAIDFDKITDIDALDAMMYGGASMNLPMKAPAGGGQQESTPPAAPAAPATPPPATPPAPAPVTPVAEPPQVGDIPPVAPPAPAELPPAPATPEPVAPTPGAPVVEPPAPVAPVPPVKTEGELSERFRFKDPQVQMALQIKKENPTLSLAECEELAKRDSASVASAPAVTSASTLLVSEQQKLEAARAKRLELATTGDGFDSEEKAQVEIEIAETAGRVAVLQTEARREEQNLVADRSRRMQESQTKAAAAFPDAANKATPLGMAVDARIKAMQDPSHPQHEILYAEDAPNIVATLVATEMGIAPRAHSPAVTPPAPAAVPPAQAAPQHRPAPTAPGSHSVTQPATSQPVTIEAAREMTLEQLDAGFGANGQPLVAAIR